MNTQNIPAWKRLGLKLKYANENIPRNPLISSGGNGERRENPETSIARNGSGGHPSQLKRFDNSHGNLPEKLNKTNELAVSTTHESNPLKRKKSVSFAADTKAEDGDSAQTIQFWIPDSVRSQVNINTVNDLTGPENSTNKIRKKRRSEREQDTAHPPRKAHAALDYLHQFQHSRSTWKFNKNHETWILKHALLVESLPHDYDLALASYLKGLKSIGARQRLIEQSREVMKTQTGSADGNAELRERFTQVLSANDDGSDDNTIELDWLKSIERSQLVLLSFDQISQSRPKAERQDSQALSRKKQRKSRTSNISIDLSSSSESDTSDDDTSDGDTSDGDTGSSSALQVEAEPKKRKLIKNIAVDSDETSSDPSTSNSSSSESE